ncbi:hypothetical protein ACX0G7_27160 [Flavitalea antarctica]
MNIDSAKEQEESAATTKQGWYFLYAVIIVLTAIDIVYWDGDFVYHHNYHCYIVGFCIFLVYFSNSQSIIDNNLFRKYCLIAALPFCILLIKMVLTTFTFPALLAISFPIIYLLILRFFLLLHFPEYPGGDAKPIHVSYTRTGVNWQGKENGYVPTRADKSFSIGTDITIYLLMGFIAWWTFVLNP